MTAVFDSDARKHSCSCSTGTKFRSTIAKAIAETREARDARLMVAAAAWAGGATIVYLVLLVILRFVGRAVTRRMLRLADSAAEKVRIGGTEVVNRARAIGFVRQPS